MKTSLACQTNDWTQWAGYTVPAVYTALADEVIAATRNTAIGDLSPEGKYQLSGKDASRFLDHLLVSGMEILGKGRVVLSPMCQSSGKVINILTVAEVEAGVWWLTCDGRHMNWLSRAAKGFDVTIKDCSQSMAGILLCGPLIGGLLRDIGLGECTDLVVQGARRFVWNAVDLIVVHRPGEIMPGVSIWCAARDAGIVWNRLMEVGAAHELVAIGQQARTAIRIDSGLPAAGHDFVPEPQALRADRMRSAIELGFGPLIDDAGRVFNGRAGLLEERLTGSALRLSQFEFPAAMPPPGARLWRHGKRGKEAVGMVTSVSPAPHLAGAKGLGFVAANRVKFGDWLEVTTRETVELLKIERDQPCRVLSIVS